MFKYGLQLIVGIFILVASAFIAWYEGSALTYKTLEWGYSTPFSKLFNIEIANGHDISQLDYFVYAAKFSPLFPAIMIVSIFYIFSVIGYYLIKFKPNLAIGFWGLIGCIMILFSSFIFNAATGGGKIIWCITSGSGLISIAVALFVSLRKFKHKANVTQIKL
ncbi:YjdJ family protein [Solibacillus silvestris]|uniref:YjdJ family protein n=1 Tax=Solibacillus silvestris TaxID=76853 RepID=UPI003F81EF55